MKLSFHRPTSRILIAGTLCLVFLLGTVLGWANTHLLSADSRFEQFTEELFQKEVSGNMLNLHYSLAYPEKKGIQRPKATLGTISLPSSQLQYIQILLYTFSLIHLRTPQRTYQISYQTIQISNRFPV